MPPFFMEMIMEKKYDMEKNLITEKDDELKTPAQIYDHDLNAETVKSLEEALAIDYIEKWKVHAQMKLYERNFLKAEELRNNITQAWDTVNANLQITSRNLEEKKIALEFEIQEKEKLKATIKELRAELKTLKKAEEVPEQKSVKKSPRPKTR